MCLFRIDVCRPKKSFECNPPGEVLMFWLECIINPKKFLMSLCSFNLAATNFLMVNSLVVVALYIAENNSGLPIKFVTPLVLWRS